MELVMIVILLALLEYMFFSFLVGNARNKYGVDAPAITGHPTFERYYRVHQNTAEQLIIFIPAILVYGYYGDPFYAAVAGVLFLLGRLVYLIAYVRKPQSRQIGFLMTFAANVLLIAGGIFSTFPGLL
ncbi:MAG: MAPEG family protein [Pseudohongiellaceae bacterium]